MISLTVVINWKTLIAAGCAAGIVVLAAKTSPEQSGVILEKLATTTPNIQAS